MVFIIRLWHYKLIPYLPKSQLLAQKRECDLIWKDISNEKKTNHILINYIWEYNLYKTELLNYYYLLLVEFKKRNYRFNDKSGYNLDVENDKRFLNLAPFHKHHNTRYLVQCFYNLEEKYDRGQADITKENMLAILQIVKEEIRKDKKKREIK